MPFARRPGQRSRGHRGQQGYILLMLMLFITVLAIVATSLVRDFEFELKRDREQEMIHRGVQYSRAVRKYVKKFGRYPTRLEELENTNNIRCLRKRYKDPENDNKDFKLLHLGDVQLGAGAGLAGATSAAQLTAGQGAQGLAAAQGLAVQAASATGSQSVNQNADSTDSSSSSESDSGDALSKQTFGGGPIVGVASFSKGKTIREFNKKNHYNQWQFIYDPSVDRGGLLSTPFQPPLQITAPNVNGQPGTTQGSGFGAQLGPGGLVVQPQQPQQPAPQPPQ